jgi:3'-phosphoadenosine 5'-phosphosulfate sulfotransferase (PAPS reductase)/FAD synthetase
MIELDRYDTEKGVEPPAEAVQTEAVEKPEPETDPVDIWESSRIIDTSGVGHGKDRIVLFSGGDDSLALTHMAMEEGWADFVVHLATNSSIPENVDYVREVCADHGWPFAIVKSPMPYRTFAYRYGFAGPPEHSTAYQYFKGRQLNYLFQRRPGSIKLLSGVRKLESDRRMRHVDAEVDYTTTDTGGNFTGWWLSPLHAKSDEWVAEYRDEHDLRRNPVSQRLHRSGDCQCFAFGDRTTELAMLEAEYPAMGKWLTNVERRVQEYRGRVELLGDRYPDVYEQVDSKRDATRPKPFRFTVLKDHAPEVYDELVGVPAEEAILRGQMEPTNYIGHGGMSSKELRDLTASADADQTTLCDTCGDGCARRSSAVENYTESAAEEFTEVTTNQTSLSDAFGQAAAGGDSC